MTELTGKISDYSRNTPLHELIAQQAVRSADKIALITPDRELTYREIDETANQLSHYFIKEGVKPGEIVGVALDRSPEMLLVLLALMKTGAAYLPIDPAYPFLRIQFMLTDSAVQYLVTSSNYLNREFTQTTQILLENALKESAVFAKKAIQCPVSGDDLIYVLYTSGSTGKPKGVLLEHHNLTNLFHSMVSMPGITETDRLLAVTTISFDIAALELYLPLVVGATIILADTATSRDGSALLRIIQENRVTIMQATPVTYKMMIAAGWQQPLSIKVMSCGEALPLALAQQLTARCDSVWNLYGPTETTIHSTCKEIRSSDELITVGRPIQNTRIYFLDENRQSVAYGSPGEICIAGDGVARGYLNRPELTAEKFIKNPFATDEWLYCTGDLGKLTPDGEIQYLGRIDQQIKIRGYRIEPGEIEHALVTQDGIQEAVVVAREDRSGTPRLVAYLVLTTELAETDFAAEVTIWRTKLKAVLPEFMVPASFINLKKLPITVNGKVDRKGLANETGMISTENKTTTGHSNPVSGWRKLGSLLGFAPKKADGE